MANDRLEYGRLLREVENERAARAAARKSPERLTEHVSLLRAAQQALDDYEVRHPSAKAKWLKEQERINEGWTPAFDSTRHDVEVQALDRLYEAEFEMSKRDFSIFSVCVEKVVDVGFHEFLLSENEASRRTGLPRSASRRSLRALSSEGRYLRRREYPRGENNSKQWSKQQGKGQGKCTNVYYIPLHADRRT